MKVEEEEVLAKKYGCKHQSRFWVTGGGVCAGTTISIDWILKAITFFLHRKVKGVRIIWMFYDTQVSVTHLLSNIFEM